jgi:CheY-like chemotaxis protein
MKILVVEDHVSHLKTANHVLSASGHNVNHAAAAKQGFTSIEAARPQLILLDLTQPGIYGWSLLRKLEDDRDTRDIYVAGVTSYQERCTRDAALDAGCDASLVKPVGAGKVSGPV